MYKCKNCNTEFEHYDTIDDNGEKWDVCPVCRGADFDEAAKCEYCGKYFMESRMDVLCKDCLDELQIKFSNMLHSNFTEYEIKALNAIYDGRNLE